MATYQEIQTWIRTKYGFSIETCWIAHVKEICGLPVRPAPNRKSLEPRKKPCPEDKMGVIKEAFRHFGIL